MQYLRKQPVRTHARGLGIGLWTWLGSPCGVPLCMYVCGEAECARASWNKGGIFTWEMNRGIRGRKKEPEVLDYYFFA